MKLIRKLGIRKNKKEIIENSPFHGKKHTEEAKQKMRESHLGKKFTDKTKQILREKKQRENNPMFGKKQTEEAKQKIGQANKGKKRTEEQNKRNSQQNKEKNNPMYGREGMLNPMYGVHRFGESSPNWNNGSSFESYGIEFNKELKQFIFKRDNLMCQNPYCEHKTNTL